MEESAGFSQEDENHRKRNVAFRHHQLKLRGQQDHTYSYLYCPVSAFCLIAIGANLFLLAGLHRWFTAGLHRWFTSGLPGSWCGSGTFMPLVRRHTVSMPCCSSQQISFTQDWDGMIKGTTRLLFTSHWGWALLSTEGPTPASDSRTCKMKQKSLVQHFVCKALRPVLPVLCLVLGVGAKGILPLAGGFAGCFISSENRWEMSSMTRLQLPKV